MFDARLGPGQRGMGHHRRFGELDQSVATLQRASARIDREGSFGYRGGGESGQPPARCSSNDQEP